MASHITGRLTCDVTMPSKFGTSTQGSRSRCCEFSNEYRGSAGSAMHIFAGCSPVLVLPSACPLLFLVTASQQAVYCHAQGFSQAKLAWKKKNAVPQTNKEAKAQRPDGRGDGGARGGRAAPNRGGGRAPMGGYLHFLFIHTSFLLSFLTECHFGFNEDSLT